MKLCFLLGSGISRPASLPSVDELTAQVLAPREFFHCPDEVYRRIETIQQSPVQVQMQMPAIERIEQFLCWLKGLAEVRYAADTGRRVNYEDLAYLAAQIHDDSVYEYENPALGPLICCALNSLPGLCSAGKLGELAGQAVNFIADVVAEMLSREPSRLDHLDIIWEAASDHRFEEVNLFSLNHDRLLENVLISRRVAVVDGFDEEDSLGIRKWNPALFDCWRAHTPNPAVRLFKLHGSIDWRRFRPREALVGEAASNPWREEYVGIRSNPALARTKDEHGRSHEERDRALFLAGTFNKMLAYLNHVFLELHYRLHRTLAETTRLVVCGYGFGDKGINNRIVDWMGLSTGQGKRKIVLIEPRSLEQVRVSSRGAIAGKLMTWKDQGSFVHWEFPIQSSKVSWAHVSNKLLSV